MSLADLGPIANHLWQSTAFLVGVWVLISQLKRNRAQVRYWLWLAASIKFLIPFAALVALGRLFASERFVSIVQPQVTFVIDAISQPFSPELVDITSPVASPSSAFVTALPILLLAIWLGGCVMHLLAWRVRWRRVAAVVRDAKPFGDGRELITLRRLERQMGIHPPIAGVELETTIEPGIFGIMKPVLIWPRGISQKFSDQQVEALITHELCHVQRRDNFGAALHMFVEALFWFHPAVWWIEKRLVDERERACDEAVIHFGSDPQLYAESILKTCEFYAESLLVCVSGVTGSDLKKRVEAIMRSHGGEKLNAWKALLLMTVGVASIAAPILVGVLNAWPIQAQTLTTSASGPAFEVASIKPNKSVSRERASGFQPGGRFLARNMTLRGLIAIAYGEPRPLPNFQIVGGPSWVDSDGFDIEAKAAGNFPETQAEAGFAKSGESMLRTLLQERFKLTVHKETRELPVYALVMASSAGKLGSQVRPSSGADCVGAPPPVNGRVPPPDPNGPPRCGFFLVGGSVGNSRHARVRFVTMDQLAKNLENSVGRTVLNRTGLAGSYSFDLEFTPGLPSAALPDAAGANADSGPSIFTALQEQLGLRLASTRGPVEVLVIDRVERPTSDDAALSNGPVPRLVARSSTQSSPTNASPTFEVASIKPNKSGERRTGIQGMQPGGRFTAINWTVRMLIRMAYRLQDFQLSGGPKWIDSDRFDIVAKADRVYTPAQLPMMMQTLLAERFKLSVHNESRDLRVYALVLASRDGKLGPRIHPSNVDCAALLASGAPPPPFIPGKVPPCATETSGGRHMIANGMTMSQLVGALSISAKGIVMDQTGLNGDFDLELEWTPDSATPAPTDATSASARPADSGPSIFTAVQEQLGLKLESTRGPVKVLVIDNVEQPTPD